MESLPVLLFAVLSLLLSDVLAFCEQSSVSVGFLYNCRIGWEDFYEAGQRAQSGIFITTVSNHQRFKYLHDTIFRILDYYKVMQLFTNANFRVLIS